MTPIRPRVATLLAAAAMLVAACGGSAASPSPTVAPTAAPTEAPTPTATPTAAPTEAPTPTGSSTAGRTGRIEVADAGFAITLADGWVEVPLSEDEIGQIVDAIPDEAVVEQLRAQLPTLLAAGVKLWAFDLASDTQGGNLIVLTQPTEIPLSLLKTTAQQAIAQVPGIEGQAEVEDVTVGGVDGVVVRYALSAETTNTPSAVQARQLYVATNGQTYIFTFTDPRGDAAVLDSMVSSVEFLP